MLYNEVNQSYVYIYPLPLALWPTANLLHSTLLSAQSTELSSLCYSAASYQLFYTRLYIYFNAPLSVHPTLSFPCCVHKPILSIRISISALQIGSSVSFF